jgi:raffinose/stachyose/melibiose transport system permease protein
VTVRREQYFTYLLLGVFSLIALVPVVGIIVTALQEQGGLASFGHPDGFHPGNFADAWREGNFADYLRSSVIVVVAVVALSTLFSILAGYAFGMMRFRGHQVLFYVLLLGLMVPLEAFIVPLYYDLRDLSLTDTSERSRRS